MAVPFTKKKQKPKTAFFIEGRVSKENRGLDSEEIAQLRKNIQMALSTSLTYHNLSFEPGENILKNAEVARRALVPIYQQVIETIENLQIVECSDPVISTTCFDSTKMRIEVHIYEQYDGNDKGEIECADITSLPHQRFENLWNELIFDEEESNLKDELIWMISNQLLVMDKRTLTRRSSPVMLLHGSPGTGKTSLCRALAQKISIRLGNSYRDTKLVEVKTANLLSHYFAQSPQLVEKFFAEVMKMCEDKQTFIIVLLDEAESILTSREKNNKQEEAQDSIRATNAVLTSIDKLKEYTNVLLLSTTNLFELLDSAFLSRCSLKKAIGNPSERTQYTILRSRLQELIDGEIVLSDVVLPGYDEAAMDRRRNMDSDGNKLLQVLEIIRAVHYKDESEPDLSGRSIAMLPETAVLRYLRGDNCDLDTAFAFIEQHVSSERAPRKERKRMDGDVLVEGDCKACTTRALKERVFELVDEKDHDPEVLRNILTLLDAGDSN